MSQYSGNAVLGVHRSEPRYIRVDGYNSVCVPTPTHAAHEWPVSAVDRLILWTYLLYKLPYFANMLVQIKIINNPNTCLYKKLFGF